MDSGFSVIHTVSRRYENGQFGGSESVIDITLPPADYRRLLRSLGWRRARPLNKMPKRTIKPKKAQNDEIKFEWPKMNRMTRRAENERKRFLFSKYSIVPAEFLEECPGYSFYQIWALPCKELIKVIKKIEAKKAKKVQKTKKKVQKK